MQMKKKALVMMCLLMLAGIIGMAQAQGGIINYGQTVTDKLDVNTPQVLYTFNGNAGEVVTAYILGWGQGFQPTLTILGPTGQLAFNAGDSLTPMTGDARITVRLPQQGAYSLLVGAADTNMNTYTLSMQLLPANISTTLTAPIDLQIPPRCNSTKLYSCS